MYAEGDACGFRWMRDRWGGRPGDRPTPARLPPRRPLRPRHWGCRRRRRRCDGMAEPTCIGWRRRRRRRRRHRPWL